MAKRRIMEGTVLALIDHIKANIASALQDLRTDRTDNKVNLTPFLDYFVYPKAMGYRTPCAFVLGRNTDFQLTRGQNAINANVSVQVSAVFQDKNAELLTYQAWRYSDVLHSILDRAHIVSTDGKEQNIVKVVSQTFGDTVEVKSQTESPFRMEVMTVLEVLHIEDEN
jgi:hypothetical protein